MRSAKRACLSRVSRERIGVEMAEEDNLVERLQQELRHEAFSRQLQEELNSKLQDEYDELLKRLAEAELHIDRMRLGSNVDLNKYFIIRYHREHHSALRQRLEAQFDPSCREPFQPGDDTSTKPAVKSTSVGTDGSPTTHQDQEEARFNSNHKDGKRTPLENNASSDDHRMKRPSSGIRNGEDTNVAASRYVPLSPHIADSNQNSSKELSNESSLQSPNDHSSRSLETSASVLDSSSSMHFNGHHTSNGFRGLKGHQNADSESQELLLQSSNLSPSLTHSQLNSSHPSSLHHAFTSSHSSSASHAHLNSSHGHTSSSPSCTNLNSSHGHTPSSYTSTDDARLSQMSASTVEIRGSTESMQLAHLFKIHGLQEELDYLKSKLNDRSFPLDEIVRDASRLHQEHQQLAQDVEALSTNLDALRSKDNGKVSDRIAKSKRAIENELAKLAEQLQEVYDLLHARTEEEKLNFPLRSPLIEKKGSDSRLSNALYDSLNSPYLPTKYLYADNQLQSPQGPPLSDGRSLSPGVLIPSLSSTPLESSSGVHLTNGAVDNMQSLKLNGHILPSRQHPDSRSRSESTNIGKNGSNSDRSTSEESNSGTPLEQLIELGVSGHRTNRGEDSNTLSDLSDEEVELQLPKDSPSRSNRSPSPLDLSQHMIPVPSPDSLHLQEAKKNLKQAEELGYSSNSHRESHSSRDDCSGQSMDRLNQTTAQCPADLSSTLNPATNGSRNTLSLPLSGLNRPSQIPRLIQSQYSPRPQYRDPNFSSYPHRQTQNSSNTTNNDGAATNKDQSGIAYPGEGDSGFAGSEFPSRTATRMDTTNPNRSLASSVLQSTISEDDANQQRFLEASAAIEALRKELADLKLQMMRNVKHSDSIPRTPSLHSHSTTKGPTSPTITTSRLDSVEYPSTSSQPKLLSREYSNNCSALSLPPHGIETPSSQHTFTISGRTSQMTTTSNNNANSPSSHHTLTNGGQSSQMITMSLTTHTNVSSHSSQSANSPSHTYSSRESSTTAVSKVDLTPKSSPSTSRQPSSVRLSTPALSSYATLKTTPIPTPQHPVTGHTAISSANFQRPDSIASGRYIGSCGPSNINGYASSTDRHLSQVSGYDSASDHCKSDCVRYYPSSQPTSVATVPSTIRRLSTRGSINHYRPPTYEEASLIPSLSNRATDSSSLVPTAISAPSQLRDSEGCASEIDTTVAGHNAGFKRSDSIPRTPSSHFHSTTKGPTSPTITTSCLYSVEHPSSSSQPKLLSREYSNNPSALSLTAQTSHNGMQSSDASVAQAHTYAPSYNNANPSYEHSQDYDHNGSRGVQVNTASAIPSDREVRRGPYSRNREASKVMSFNGAQTPMAASTPSRRSAVLSARHIHAQTPYSAREKLNERFKISRDLPERENSTRMPAPSLHNNIPDSGARPNIDVPPTGANSRRYSSTSASRSPQSQRKKSSEDFTIYSTHSSPARSHAHGYSSGVSSSIQSSPSHGYFNTRRASNPALYTSAHKKSYREKIVKEHGRVRHSDNRGRYPEDSSSESGEERYHDRDAYLSSEGHDEVCATHDDRTPHVHGPMSARSISMKRRYPLRYHHDDHCSDPETSPEHHYYGHTKPQVVRVIKTPKPRKKRVVYLASNDPPPEEIYYSESGSGLFTPHQPSHGRRVVGVVGSRNGRSVSRGEGVRTAQLRRGGRPRKVYVEQPSEPVKRVYIVEQESGSDLEQFETIEMRELDLDDTLQLANELKRRTKQLQGTLQAELERQAFH